MRILAFIFFLAGCLCSPGGGGPRGSASRCSWGDRVVSDAVRSFEVGEAPESADEFILVESGSSVALVSGFQGSEMFLLRMRVLKQDTDPTEVCALITAEYERTDVDAASGAFPPVRVSTAVTMSQIGDHLTSGSIEFPDVGGSGRLSVQVSTDVFTTETSELLVTGVR